MIGTREERGEGGRGRREGGRESERFKGIMAFPIKLSLNVEDFTFYKVSRMVWKQSSKYSF